MAVSLDNRVESHTGTTGSISQASFQWTHAVLSTARGCTVIVVNLGSAAFIATSVKWDWPGSNTDIPEVTACRAQDTAGETGAVQVFHLGAPPAVPGNNSIILVNRTNNTDELWAVSATVNANADTEIYEAGIVLLEGDGTLAEQNVDDGSPGTNSLRMAGGFSGLAAPPTPGGSSSSGINFDTGNQTAAYCAETNVGQGSRPVGFSSGTADDRAFTHFAVREVVAAAKAPPPIHHYRKIAHLLRR